MVFLQRCQKLCLFDTCRLYTLFTAVEGCESLYFSICTHIYIYIYIHMYVYIFFVRMVASFCWGFDKDSNRRLTEGP